MINTEKVKELIDKQTELERQIRELEKALETLKEDTEYKVRDIHTDINKLEDKVYFGNWD